MIDLKDLEIAELKGKLASAVIINNTLEELVESGGWISMADEQPSKTCDILAYVVYGENEFIELIHCYICPEYGTVILEDRIDCEDYTPPVTHWMPLPEPPKC